uniref:Astacin domain-containing protein n=1 Tax=Strongyloides papillosus TaxID=174720 RepID=A0A0N5BGS2_STREA
MKIFFLILLVPLCIAENSKSKTIEESTSLAKQRPPYYISPKLNKYYFSNDSISTKLHTIFNQLRRNTCLDFRKQTSRIQNEIGINFDISKEGKSIVELSNSTSCPTNISLSENDYTNHTLLRFYLGIALDIIPEVRRPDRDIDVNVTISNVKSEFIQYYNITNSSYIKYLNDTEFDFRSPMFFGPDFGSNDNKPTYEVLLYKNDQHPSGFGRPFRHNFYKHIFYYYCGGSTIPNNCKYGGYPYPKEKNKCKCPEYLSGTNCENFNNQSTTVKYTIKGPLKANSSEQEFSINLTSTTFYLNITSEQGRNISVTVKNITFTESNCSSFGSFLDVLIRKDKGSAGMYLCRNTSNLNLPPLSNEVFFVLYARKENISFSISYKEVGENKTESQKEIS